MIDSERREEESESSISTVAPLNETENITHPRLLSRRLRVQLLVIVLHVHQQGLSAVSYLSSATVPAEE